MKAAVKFLHMKTLSFDEFSKMTIEINLEDISFLNDIEVHFQRIPIS